MADSEILTSNDLKDLTGYRQPASQCRWLDNNGIGYRVSSHGKPKTTWSAVNACLIHSAPSPRPHFDRIR